MQIHVNPGLIEYPDIIINIKWGKVLLPNTTLRTLEFSIRVCTTYIYNMYVRFHPDDR